jgi:hypothetical protein
MAGGHGYHVSAGGDWTDKGKHGFAVGVREQNDFGISVSDGHLLADVDEPKRCSSVPRLPSLRTQGNRHASVASSATSLPVGIKARRGGRSPESVPSR